ncbi:MAG: hypothetical protein HEEMFOPI_00039 [Holosporales bacterium]
MIKQKKRGYDILKVVKLLKTMEDVILKKSIKRKRIILFFSSLCVSALHTATPQNTPPEGARTSQPVLTSNIFQDPGNYASYGGPSANQIFQHYSSQMPEYVAQSIRNKVPFEEIFEQAVKLRGTIAEQSKTPNHELFGALRSKKCHLNEGSVASITPVLKYPFMARLMRFNVKQIERSLEYKPLDDMFEYQFLTFNTLQWRGVIQSFFQIDNMLASAVFRMFNGKDGQGDSSMLVFDYKHGWKNGMLQSNNHFAKALLKAYEKAGRGIVDDDLRLTYLRIRFKGTNVETRSVIFPTDSTALEDLSNVPFALVHPSLENMDFHMFRTKAAFEAAHRAIGDEENKKRRIAEFAYLSSLTMPLIRGSAAVNKWLTSGLCNFHGLQMPHEMMDEIAQSSFTFEQFYQEFYRVPFIPKDLGSQEYKLFEEHYERYFLPPTYKNAFEDFLSQPSGVTEQKRDEEVVISLTSYPERILTTWAAIESFLRQKEILDRPDRIVLTLFEGEFPGRKLPWAIEQQLKRGLEINWSPVNRKVFLKSRARDLYPNSVIVLIDDDIVYPNNRLKALLDGYRAHPDCVIAQDVRVIPSVNGVVPPVAYWRLTGYSTPNEEMGPAFNLAPEGYQGILYPPNSLAGIFDDETHYNRLCPTDDDVWGYLLTVIKRIKVFKIANTGTIQFIEEAQKSSKTLGAINGQDQNRLYNVYMERIVEEGLLRNAGFYAFEKSAVEFLKTSITSVPKQVVVSSYSHTDMLNVPMVFETPFTVLLRDGIFLRGPSGSFKVLTGAFKKASSFHIKIHVVPTLTPTQPFIKYALSYKGRIFKQGIIAQQLQYLEFRHFVEDGVQEYGIVTTSTRQDLNWVTLCIKKIEFNPEMGDHNE